MRLSALKNFFNNPKTAVFVVLLVSLIFRIAFVMTMEREGFYFIDTTDYDKAATKIIKEGTFGYEYERPPVYPVFLAALYLVSYQDFILVRIAQCILGSLICLLIFLIGKKVYGFKTGLIAGLIYAVYPIHIFISGILYPTILITLWLLLVVYFLLRSQEYESVIGSLIAGFFMGLAILTKPISIILLLLLIPYFIVKKKLLGTRYISSLFLFLSCTFIVTSIWITRNYLVKEEISLIESNKKLEEHLRSLDTTQKEEPLSIGTRLNRIFFQQGDRFLRHFGSELIHFWEFYPGRLATEDRSKRALFKTWDDKFQTNNPYIGNRGKYISILSFAPVFAFGILGFYFSIQKGKKVFLLISPILSFWFGYSLFYAKTRYRIPVEPFLIVLAAWGLTTISGLLITYSNRVIIQKKYR